MTPAIGHTRPFYEYVPPLEDRVLDTGGREILAVLADAKGWMPIGKINRIVGREKTYDTLASMADLDWIEKHPLRRLDTYRLTDAGWGIAGGKPGWM